MTNRVITSLKRSGTPLVALSLYRFKDWHKLWAFGQMARGRFLLQGLPHLRFWKLLGTGKGIGFSIVPDLAQYGVLTVWDDPDAAFQFNKDGQLPKAWQKHAYQQQHFYLVPFKSQGLWSGTNPFEPVWQPEEFNPDNRRIAILTRASIAWHALLRFWQHVPSTSDALAKCDGIDFSAGLGEAPFVHQATFSIWQNAQAMREYAYASKAHQAVIKKTRREQWYAEELFARFFLLDELTSL